MAIDPQQDRWIPPCDLCGGLDFEKLTLPGAELPRRCRTCGLISLTAEGDDPNERPTASLDGELGPLLRAQALRLFPRLPKKQGGSVLLIGRAAAQELGAAAAEAGLVPTALVPPGTQTPSGVIRHENSLENVTFPPEQFDCVVCGPELGSLPAPSLLFKQAERWLVTDGVLILTAANSSALSARLWRSNWLNWYVPDAAYLMSRETINSYADRFGYDIRTSRTGTSVSEAAGIATADEAPSGITRLITFPISMLERLFGMGEELCVVLIKRGLAVRPMIRALEEGEEGASDFAPALYSSSRRVSRQMERL